MDLRIHNVLTKKFKLEYFHTRKLFICIDKVFDKLCYVMFRYVK